MNIDISVLGANSPVLLVVLCLFAYVLGSVPFGLILAKTFCGIDPRTAGSGNVGSTNVARLCGLKWGIFTLICDAFKGAFPVYVALYLGFPLMGASVVALPALLGHLFSMFLKFKGGKAVATTVGVFIPLSFTAILISGGVCLVVIALTRYVSAGSLVLALLLPISVAILGLYDLLPLAIIVMLLILLKHRENIKRLLKGEEKAFLKSKAKS